MDLPITVVGLSLEQTLGSVTSLARSHGHSAYDASYLDRATREGLPLASQDARLIEAAVHVGVQLVE